MRFSSWWIHIVPHMPRPRTRTRVFSFRKTLQKLVLTCCFELQATKQTNEQVKKGRSQFSHFQREYFSITRDTTRVYFAGIMLCGCIVFWVIEAPVGKRLFPPSTNDFCLHESGNSHRKGGLYLCARFHLLFIHGWTQFCPQTIQAGVSCLPAQWLRSVTWNEEAAVPRSEINARYSLRFQPTMELKKISNISPADCLTCLAG